MTHQLKLVLYAYDLELTPDEQATLFDEVSFYHEIHEDYYNQDDDDCAAEEERLIYEIENLVDPFTPREVKTRTISFNRDHLEIIHDALYEKEELYSSTYDRYHDEDDLKVINKEGNLIGIWGDIYKKINEALESK